MSENFQLAIDSQPKPQQLEMMQTWSAWLETCIGEICQEKSEYLKQFVSKYLDIWHNKNNPGVFWCVFIIFLSSNVKYLIDSNIHIMLASV